MSFDSILNAIDDIVWGRPTIILILATGLLLTIRLRGMQFSKLIRAFKSIFRKGDGESGEVSSFGALCTALSATIGTGNIVGVATAIAAGGPGALFWMWLAALVGTATKYAECMLSVKYREQAADGHVLGGPFYTIEKGMKEVTGFSWKWLAVLFAVFGVCVGLFGIGTFTQINGIASAVKNAFDPETKYVAFNLFGLNYSWSTVIAGALVTIFSALVIIGGLKRISKVAQVIVPFMAVLYVFLGVSVLVMNATKIRAALSLIFHAAFAPKAVTGGMVGTMMIAMQKGSARGIFSNEAGLGSAAIAASTAQVEEPVAQGLVSMTGTFIDTIIVCTMTGLSIVIAFTNNGVFTLPVNSAGEVLRGVDLTSAAFNTVLGGDGISVQFLLMICLIFFAFTTILGWDYYSERCLEYLTNGKLKAVMAYRIIYIIAVAIGPYMTISQVWTIADITNGLMAWPNCIALIVLSGVAAKTTQDFFKKYPTLESENK